MRQASWLWLILLGALAFINAIRHPFVHDDVIFILQNPHIAQLGEWYKAFEIPAASDGLNTYYRPFLEILYRIEYHFFGFNPWYYHLINIIIHLINGLLLFGLLQKLGLKRELSWLISLLFLIHPIQTEAVSCISGISNLWMALGIFLGLHAYLNQWYIGSLGCFVAAFLGKEQAVMFVPLVMVIDIYLGRKNGLKWLGIILIAGILLAVRHFVTGSSLFKDMMVSPGELYLRLEAIPRDIGMYLRLIFFPYDLHYYRNTDILQSNHLAWGLAMVSILGILAVIYRWPQVRPLLFLGIGWFLVTLLPVLNVVPLINEYSFILTAEHFLYLPMIGIVMIAVTAGDYWIKQNRKLVLGMIICVCLILTWYQNTFWGSEIVLFERMIRFEPKFGRGHLLLANAYVKDGQIQKAGEQYQDALAIMTSYAKKASNPIAKEFYLKYIKEISFDMSKAGYFDIL